MENRTIWLANYFILVSTEPHKIVTIFFYQSKTELFVPILNANHNLNHSTSQLLLTVGIPNMLDIRAHHCSALGLLRDHALNRSPKLGQKKECRKKCTPKYIRLWISKKATTPLLVM